jgi:5-methylcytosine-specific restriction endonuclease McrA
MPYKDPEARKAYQRAHYLANQEKIKARVREVWDALPIEIRRERGSRRGNRSQEGTIYYAHNRDRVLASQKQKYENNTEYRQQRVQSAIQWQKDNPDKVALRSIRRKMRKLNAFIEDVDRNTLYEMYGGCCGICKEFIDLTQTGFHVDHVIPLSKGGMHGYINTQPAHPKCNLRKGSKLW